MRSFDETEGRLKPVRRTPEPPQPVAPLNSAPNLQKLQQAAGNGAVTEMLAAAGNALTVQRGILPGALRFDKGTPEEIAAAIKSNDPADVKAIDNFEKATGPQRVQLIDVLLSQSTIGVFDRNAMDRIWAHVDVDAMEDNALARFRTCVERGWKPQTYRYLTLVSDFKESMKSAAISNLTGNVELLKKEADRLGASNPEQVAADPAKDAAIAEQQDLAQLVVDAKKLMAKARNIVVGQSRQFQGSDRADYFNLQGPPVKFDPDHEPTLPQVDPVTVPDPYTKRYPWKFVYERYSALAQTVADVMANNPAIYILSTSVEPAPDDPGRGGEPGRLNFGQTRITGFENLSPVEARKKAATAMVETYNNARQSMGLVMANKIDPLSFDTLAARHRKGEFGPKYTTPFAKFTMDHAIAQKGSSLDETMANIGLVLLLASVAIGTAGAATPLIGGVMAAANIGSAAALAAQKTFEAQNLNTIASSSATSSGEVVSQQAAARAQLDATMYQFAVLAAAAGEAVGPLLAAGRGATGELTNFAALSKAEQATSVAAALERMEVGQVALRTGLAPEDLQVLLAKAPESPSIVAARSRISDFLFGGPLNAATGGKGKTLASILRQTKQTFRELMQRAYGIAIAAEDQVFLVPGATDAELRYVSLIEGTPGREAAIYRNTATGEHAVVQGTGNWSGGGVSHAETVLGPSAGRWTLVEHYHPERNFAVQFPSGAQGDFGVLLYDYGETNAAAVLAGTPSTNITSRVSARIRYRDPVTGNYHFTTYGYDPAAGPIGRFFVSVETRGGGIVDYNFHSMAELQGTINRIKKDIAVVQ
ncbi:hypothetical protein [Mycolicibacterium wolinskyi]|uniref:hypothetical protein n=1 Tax=Mycolicibacterium wolinskyi TaxID=59750 RepID=UPI00104206B7|nr:hypothetical protein [Mycolicibacterium wolinskyi]